MSVEDDAEFEKAYKEYTDNINLNNRDHLNAMRGDFSNESQEDNKVMSDLYKKANEGSTDLMNEYKRVICFGKIIKVLEDQNEKLDFLLVFDKFQEEFTNAQNKVNTKKSLINEANKITDFSYINNEFGINIGSAEDVYNLINNIASELEKIKSADGTFKNFQSEKEQIKKMLEASIKKLSGEDSDEEGEAQQNPEEFIKSLLDSKNQQESENVVYVNVNKDSITKK